MSRRGFSRNGLRAALDIGSTKVLCCIARPEGDSFRVLGLGHQASKGMRAGIVVDMEEVESSIVNAVHAAEQMAGDTIREVYVSITGNHLSSQIVETQSSVSGQSVTDGDIRRILSQARLLKDPSAQDIIHVIPLDFSLDGTKGIRDPRGMCGSHLGVDVHMITAGANPLKNLLTCIGRCHLDVAGLVVASFASGLSTLVEDEMDLGATVLDLGGSTTSFGVFLDGNLMYADSLPLGGSHVTNDIARGLGTSLTNAERLKTLHGHAVLLPQDEREMIIIPQLGEGSDSGHPHQIPRSHLIHIIQARLEEIFELVRHKLDMLGVDRMVSHRVILTGGGSQLPGIRDLAARTLKRHVRLGKPAPLIGLSEGAEGPGFAVCAGLLSYAQLASQEGLRRVAVAKEAGPSFFGRMSQWIRENL